MTRAGRCAPFLALVLAGCLASKSDVALLQTQLNTMSRTAATASEAQRAQVDRAIEQILAQIGRNNDSVRVVSARLAKLQGDVQNDHYEMGRQILQLQELSGQSQKRISELRASLEERNNQAGVTPPVPGDTAHPAPGGPGPAQLFQNSLDQLRRGATGVARNGFEELLRSYPSTDDAPEAMVYIAETYAAERNQAAADSVYGLVIQRYPKSPKAATALYKRALSMKAAGQTAAARAAFDRIIKEYPRTDEADLAKQQLRTIR
ncbi:MAG: tetratricopeptide repeat protein [bacterium]